MSKLKVPRSISQISDSLISDDAEYQMPKNRTFIQRTFSPIQQGAMRGSIFALLASAMGTGMFNLPFRINEIGIIPYIFFVICGGLFSYFGMFLISRLILRFKIASYSEMSQRSYGKVFRKISQFCLIIYPWGITVCFQVIFAKFVVQFLNDVCQLDLYEAGGRNTDVYNSTGNLIRILISVAAILINLIFVLKKEIGILQKVAMVGVLSVVINVFIIAVTFILGFDVPADDVTAGYHYGGITSIKWSELKWFQLNNMQDLSAQVQGMASIIFCYVNHQLVFPLMFDLKNPTKKRINKIFNRVHITEIIIYTLVGMCGYLLLAEHEQQRPIAPVVMASIVTTAMSIGKLFMMVALFFAVPLNLFPARQVIYDTFTLQKNNNIHVILSLSLAFSGTVIAIFFQQVNSYFGLLGGTAGVMMAGLIPMICYYKLIGLNHGKTYALLVFMILISLIGIIGAFMSVIDPS